MATLPPSPFTSSAEVVMPSVDTAAASPVHTPGTVDAAANQFGTGPAMQALDVDDHRFVLDEERFLADIEPLPLFLQAPLDVLSVLAAY